MIQYIEVYEIHSLFSRTKHNKTFYIETSANIKVTVAVITIVNKYIIIS